MNLAQSIELYAGGPGSGCHGPNCGRPEGPGLTGREGGRLRRMLQEGYRSSGTMGRLHRLLRDGQPHTVSEIRKSLGDVGVRRIAALDRDGVGTGAWRIQRSGNTVRMIKQSTQGVTQGVPIPGRVAPTSTVRPTMPQVPVSPSLQNRPVPVVSPNASFRQPKGFLKKGDESNPQNEHDSKVHIDPMQAVAFKRQFEMSPVDYKNKMLDGVSAIDPKNASVTIRMTGDQRWNIEMQGRNDNGSFRQTRDFDLRDGSVSHSYWQIDESLQNAGLGKEIFKNQLDLYDHLGIKKINIHANISVGGYAWARYGFVPNQYSWDSLRGTLTRRLDTVISDPAVRAKAKVILNMSDPKGIWLLAGMNDKVGDTTVGKKLLLHTDWSGSIDLTNQDTYSVTKSYVSSRHVHAAALQAEPVAIVNGKKTDKIFHKQMLQSPSGQNASDMLAVKFAISKGWDYEDAVNSFVLSPVLRKKLLARKLKAYGTSDGVKKAWDTRGRGRKELPEKDTVKQALAKSSFVLGDVTKQRAAEANERLIAGIVQGIQSGDNAPFDILIPSKNIGIEVKTRFPEAKNDRVNLHVDGRQRKGAAALKQKLSAIYTISLDSTSLGVKQATIDDVRSGNVKILIKSGVGAYRYNSMHTVKDEKELYDIISNRKWVFPGTDDWGSYKKYYRQRGWEGE